MDDEALTPFVDALSATLIIMVLVSISFIIQSSLVVSESAKKYVEIKVVEDKSTPIVFNRPIKIDLLANELVYLVNFELTSEEIESIKNDILVHKSIEFVVSSKDTEKKAVANLVRFLIALNLPKEINVKTKIIGSDGTLSKLTWGK